MGGRRRAVHRCLATADVAVVRLGVACCLCWKPWLANAAEGRMVLAVQDRRGRASRVRSADGAAMFDASRDRAVCRWMLSGRSTGVAVTLRRCCQGLRPEIAISAGQTSNHEAAGEPYRYRYCSPLRQNLGLGSIELSKSLRRNLTVAFWKDVDSSDCIPKLDKPLVGSGHLFVPT
jgi:hypothetical protein